MSTTQAHSNSAFVTLIAAGLAAIAATRTDSANQVGWRHGKYDQLEVDLHALRQGVSRGNLPRPSREDFPTGTGLALVNGAREWCDDRQVLVGLTAIDECYRSRF